MVAISSIVTMEINPLRDFSTKNLKREIYFTLIFNITIILNFHSTELPLTLTVPVGNKSRISYTVGIQFTDSQFHIGILSCPFLMEQSNLSARGSFNNYVDKILPNFDPLPLLEWANVDNLHTNHVTLIHVTKLTIYLPLFVNVVIE